MMRVYSITELMRLTRTELCALLNRISATLWNLPEGSPARHAALTNLANIRRVLARRDPSPG
jgi:hypothetical protein